MEAGGQTAAPAELRRPGGSQMRGRGAESEAARTCCEAAAEFWAFGRGARERESREGGGGGGREEEEEEQAPPWPPLSPTWPTWRSSPA